MFIFSVLDRMDYVSNIAKLPGALPRRLNLFPVGFPTCSPHRLQPCRLQYVGWTAARNLISEEIYRSFSEREQLRRGCP